VGRELQVLRVLTSLAMSMKYSSHDGRIIHLFIRTLIFFRVIFIHLTFMSSFPVFVDLLSLSQYVYIEK
jgi:hypothetical protein